MTTYDNSNRGGLWRNKDQKTDKHPTMKGTLNVDGVEYELAAWSKVPKAGGDRYLQLAVQKKREIEQKPPENGKAISSVPADFADDLPF